MKATLFDSGYAPLYKRPAFGGFLFYSPRYKWVKFFAPPEASSEMLDTKNNRVGN
jgi:hypothetical protein